MPSCFAKFCSHNSNIPKQTNIKYFVFPKDSKDIRIWLENAGMESEMIDQFIPLIQEDVRGNIFRMCSAHFNPTCFIGQEKYRKLRPESVPTIFMETATDTVFENKWEKN